MKTSHALLPLLALASMTLWSCSDDPLPGVDNVGCRLNSDCPANQICQGGACVDTCAEDGCPCLADGDCPGDQLCEAGACFEPQCGVDAPCGLGERCERGVCEVDPEADRDLDGVPDGTVDNPRDNCPTTANPDQSDLDADGEGDVCDEDDDGDGVADAEDNCPRDRSDQMGDQDGDGIGDICDEDIDGDGLTNPSDNCPLGANPNQSDEDGDGLGDVCDPDRDNDSVDDEVDNCPLIGNPGQDDLDNDGDGDVCDEDIDGDGVVNAEDNCPLERSDDVRDLDEDGIGDVCDTDIDNDGLTNLFDNCPRTPNPGQENRDGDERGDACDLDLDGDGAPDNFDNCLGLPNPDQADQDEDGIGDICDVDIDGDGVPNLDDNCPRLNTTDRRDTDGDGQGDACDGDDDNDGVADTEDNCIRAPNPDQEDFDDNGVGDACDRDLDFDTIIDLVDNCVGVPNTNQSDIDGDVIGDACDLDIDGDGVLNGDDNCPELVTTNRLDLDFDGVGDACDPDIDGDGVDNLADNCPRTPNPDQADTAQDEFGAGDACDHDLDDDGLIALVDNCPLVFNPDQANADEDALGNACDADDDDDFIPDVLDNCPTTPSRNLRDIDEDGLGDVCDPDDDNDNVLDDGDDSGLPNDALCEGGQTLNCDDNCRRSANRDQRDENFDRLGDACESDRDLDGVIDDLDVCVLLFNPDQADLDRDGQGDACDPDVDGDGVPNPDDNCPRLKTSLREDLDLDGIGDACDPDLDNDRVSNPLDNCPRRANEDQIDLNVNGIGDVCDQDSDGDRVIDDFDNCPLTINFDQADLDRDGEGDECDPDIEGDGVVNGEDNCPRAPNFDQGDTDDDGQGDACDPDLDGDLIANELDNCPTTPNPDQLDLDDNGIGDACQSDLDDDGVFDTLDNCPLDPNLDQDDTDGDGQGDACDEDLDGDGVANEGDNCPGLPNPGQRDTDRDGLGDVCDEDIDGDTVGNGLDNCPTTPNPDQLDGDEDGIGDACEFDIDDDTIADLIDNCPEIFNPDQADLDLDGLGDVCDTDIDGDTLANDEDNCPRVPSFVLRDQDEDGEGDICDLDIDGDGLPNEGDNCPLTPNPDQLDGDEDGIGDACRGDGDDDGVIDDLDNCRDTTNIQQRDFDLDGLGDACDPDADNDGIVNGLDNCPLAPNPSQEDPWGFGLGLGCVAEPLQLTSGRQNLHTDTRGLSDDSALPCGGEGAPDMIISVALDSQERLNVALAADHDTLIGLTTEAGELIQCIQGDRLDFQAPFADIPNERQVYRLILDGVTAQDTGPLSATIARRIQTITDTRVVDMLGRGPTRSASGHLVGDDGIIDHATANSDENNISIIDGATGTSVLTLPTGALPSDIQAADLDGDGLDDLVVSNAETDTISWHRGVDDLRLFDNPREFDTGAAPTALGVGFINGDDALDVVVVNGPDDALTLWLGGDEGPFAQRLSVALEPGARPTSLFVDDIDEDGFDDIAVTHGVLNQAAGAVTILFGAAQAPPAQRATFPAAQGAADVTAADIDDDGIKDLAVVNNTDQSLLVYLGDGQRGFADPLTFAGGPSPVQLDAGDINGDGVNDVVVANTEDNALYVYLGTGQARSPLQTPVLILDTTATAAGPSDVDIEDLDGDGIAEFVVPGAELLPSFNDPRPISTPSLATFAFVENALFNPPRRTPRPYDNAPEERLWQGDLDLDGVHDLVRLYPSRMDVFWSSNLKAPTRELLDLPTGITSTLIRGIDVDGDGYTDIVIGGSDADINVAVLRNLQGRTFDIPRVFPTNTGLRNMVTIDLDKDGHPDIITRHLIDRRDELRVLWGRAGIDFEVPSELLYENAHANTTGLSVGHLDDDPHLDIIWTQQTRNFTFFWGQGSRQFELEARNNQRVSDPVFRISVADVDLDGHSDMIMRLASRTRMVEVHYGDGQRGFTIAPDIVTPGLGAQGAFVENRIADVVKDMDDDGYPDLLFSHAVTGPNSRPSNERFDANIIRMGFGPDRAVIYEQNPFEYTLYDSRFGTQGWKPEAISSFDIDNDGLHELMTTHLGLSRGEDGRNRESQLFTNRQRPGQGAGDRFADANLPPCGCTTLTADLDPEGASVATFEVQPGEDCRVVRAVLDVQAEVGDGRPAAFDITSPAEDTARILAHGSPLPEGQWRPDVLSGLARFEGSTAAGSWRLTSTSAACDPDDEACPALHSLRSASLSLNCAPEDPLGDQSPAPACTNDTDPGELPETACAWTPLADLSGTLGVEDRDRMIVVGPAGGGFPVDALVALRVSVARTEAPPLISLGLHGARRPLVRAIREGPDDERPGFDIWTLTLRIDTTLAGRYLSLDLNSAPAASGELAYTVARAEP